MESYFENSDHEEELISAYKSSAYPVSGNYTSCNSCNKTPIKNSDSHQFYLKAKLDLNIEKFTVEKDTQIALSEQIYSCFNNPNMVLLIIEDMCLGLIMTDHIATKFEYIKQTLEYRKESQLSANPIPTYLDFPIKIIKIDKNWDTRIWNYYKISRIYFEGVFDKIEHYPLKEAINYFKKNKWVKNDVCLNFLTALSWHGGEEKFTE